MNFLHLYIGIVFILFSCKKEIGPQNLGDDSVGNGSLLVLNEGNFGFGNASVSKLNPETGEIFNNQYKLINGVGIGDVLQSAKRYRNKYYFVVNNSGKVVVTDTNLVFLKEINGFNSPRYMECVGDFGYVTDLKQMAVYVVDLISNSIVSEIKTQGWTEDIILYNSELLVLDRGDYLTNSDSNYIYTIDPVLNRKTDSIRVGMNPNSMQMDNNGFLWVLNSGKTSVDFPSLTQYDLTTKSIVFQTIFSSYDIPSNLVYSVSMDRLYFLNNSMYSISSDGSESIPQLFYRAQSENFYGLNVIHQKLFVTDAKSYNQTGDVNIFTLRGEKTNTVSSGLIPSVIIR